TAWLAGVRPWWEHWHRCTGRVAPINPVLRFVPVLLDGRFTDFAWRSERTDLLVYWVRRLAQQPPPSRADGSPNYVRSAPIAHRSLDARPTSRGRGAGEQDGAGDDGTRTEEAWDMRDEVKLSQRNRDAAFFDMVHELVRDNKLLQDKITAAKACDRRREKRMPFPYVQLLAPFDGENLPLQSEFRHVQCCDIS